MCACESLLMVNSIESTVKICILRTPKTNNFILLETFDAVKSPQFLLFESNEWCWFIDTFSQQRTQSYDLWILLNDIWAKRFNYFCSKDYFLSVRNILIRLNVRKFHHHNLVKWKWFQIRFNGVVFSFLFVICLQSFS